jgi:rod shape-determining protein MreD
LGGAPPRHAARLVIVLYFFIEDILLLRAPPAFGRWLCCWDRVSAQTHRDIAPARVLAGISAMVAGLMLAMFVANRAVLAIVMVPQAPLGLSFAQFLGTVLSIRSLWRCRISYSDLRKPATGEVDALGQRL